MELPIFSIVVPSFNYGRYLSAAVESALVQDGVAKEVLVIDGGSSDESCDVLATLAPRLAFWQSCRDRGQTDALNQGFAKTTGDVFAWLNADDAYLHDHCLAEVAAVLQTGADVVVGRVHNVDGLGRPYCATESWNGFSRPQSFEEYLRFWDFVPFPQPAVFVTRSLAAQCFPLDVGLRMTMDYQFFLRVLARSPRVAFSDRTWVKFRYHGENKTLTAAGYHHELHRVATSEARLWLTPPRRRRFLRLADAYVALVEAIPIGRRMLLSCLVRHPAVAGHPLFWKAGFRSILGERTYRAAKRALKGPERP